MSPSAPTKPAYAFDAAWAEERRRLAGIEALWDPGTFNLLEALGPRPDWRCLEVGPGGGTVAARLAGRTAHVLAGDLDPRFCEPLATETLEVRRFDVTTDPLPEGAYDLVHTRLVLGHLPERFDVVGRLADALRPGGWLVVEDYDFTPFGFLRGDAVDAATSEGVLGYLASQGFDPAYGRQVTEDLAAHGLEDVRGEGRQAVLDASHPGWAFFALSVEHVAPRAVDAGLMSPEVAEIAARRMREPGRRIVSPSMIAAVGRRAP